ncbi:MULTISPECIES: OmpA family protein [unclassified Aureispira]|uniref:OmpA family protein n=1 Tax=unclassified Aureispira TaxID=2649989 RepID=UPI0006976EDE|nr:MULTISPECIES: OmpA family protein [unclassified Aureispira]WMX12171.1 OmpA family protein [Aureispira sp. CCB-E]
MKLNNILVIIALLFVGQAAFAQPTNNNLTSEMKENIGDEERNKKNTYTALEWYIRAYEADNNDGAAIYKIASTNEMLRDYKAAAEWYQKLVALNKKDEFPLSRYEHAVVMKMTGDYDNCIPEFEAFIKEYPSDAPKADYYKKMAQIHIDGAKWAKNNMEPTEELIIENAGPNVNSLSTEGGAFPLGRDEIIYASLRADTIIVKEEGEDYEHAKIYIAKSEGDGKWGEAKEFNADVLQKEGLHVVEPAFNDDQTKFYFVRAELIGNQLENSRIYVADYADGTVSNPKLLDFNSSSYSCQDPAFATWDGKDYLLFTSNMEGGKGGMDIWYAEINEDGTTKEPLNLEAVNTIGDDLTPFFDERNNTLYFSSDGHPGFGGWDIFRTERAADGSMGKVVNMGAGFNTYVDDFSFTVNKVGKDDCYAYILSNRPGTMSMKSETCCDDIFSVIMPERCDIIMDVAVMDEATGEPMIGATVQLIDKETGKVVDEQSNTEGNDYTFSLDMGKKYDIVAKKDGVEGSKESVDATKEALTAAGLDITKPMEITKEVKIKELGLMVQAFDKKTNAALDGVTVIIYEASSGKEVKQLTKGTGNEFAFVVPRDKDYKIFANREGYIADTRVVAQKDLGMVQKMYLTPPPVFYNVYFSFNKSNIRQGAADTLDMVLATLKDNPEMIVEVRGHTDALGSDQYNISLSDRRSNATIAYLVKKGIDKNRLQPKALGEQQPAADNTKTDGSDNPEGRALNRRVEFKIVNGTLGINGAPEKKN